MNSAYKQYPVGSEITVISESYGTFTGIVLAWPFEHEPADNELATRWEHQEEGQGQNCFVKLD